jgi:hypothetical protein
MSAPGALLRRWAARVCHPNTVERLVDPALTDMQLEYAESLADGTVWRARAVLLRGYLTFWIAGAAHASAALWLWTQDAIGGRRGAITQMWWLNALTVAGVGVFFGIFTLVVVGSARADGVARLVSAPRTRLIVSAWLQGAMALPLGAMVGAVALRREGPIRRRSGTALVALTLTATALAVAALISIPDANQFLRETIFGAPLRRGANELSFTELSANLSRIDLSQLGPLGLSEVLWMRMSYHLRIAFVVSPFAFAWLGLTIAAAIQSRPVRTIVLVGLMMLYAAYYVVPDFDRLVAEHRVVPEVAAWSPLVLAVIAAWLLTAVSWWRREPRQVSVSGSV